MPLRRAAVLTILAWLALAAPAAASERSAARQFAAAMQPALWVTPGEGEALLADYEARSAHIAATCLPSVEAAGSRPRRVVLVGLLYSMHANVAFYEQLAGWMGDADARLAAVEADSRTLRRARSARTGVTAFVRGVVAAAPADFCALVTGWRAKGWKGTPPGAEPLLDLIEAAPGDRADRRIRRGQRLLRRHGATRARVRAFGGMPRWPGLREPAPDPVLEALVGDGSESPENEGRHGGWAVASGAHAW